MDLHEIVDEAIMKWAKDNPDYVAPIQESVIMDEEHHTRTVRPSSLGYCPLRAARQKNGIKPDLPALTADGAPETVLLVKSGVVMAEWFQNAISYWAKGREDVDVEIEKQIITGGFHGYVDLIIHHEGRIMVVEMKYSMETANHIASKPKLGHMLQALCYGGEYKRSTGKDVEMYVLTIGKADYKTWALGNTATLGVLDDITPYDTRNGDEYQTPYYWGSVTMQRVYDEALIISKYITGEITDIPVSDPYTDKNGFWCVEKKKPTKTKDGYVKPRCPWVKSCHGIEEEQVLIAGELPF